MKPKYWMTASLIALCSSLFTSYGSLAQPAPGERGVFCDTSTGDPITVYQNSDGGHEPWIQWVSDAFSDAGYDPLTRCREVSGRLETYRRNKELKYITAGQMNSQSVICTANEVRGRCEGLIFTLKPGQSPIRTLNHLRAWLEGQAGTSSMMESGTIPYIDMRRYLEDSSPTSMPMTSPRNVQPLPQQSAPKQGPREL